MNKNIYVKEPGAEDGDADGERDQEREKKRAVLPNTLRPPPQGRRSRAPRSRRRLPSAATMPKTTHLVCRGCSGRHAAVAVDLGVRRNPDEALGQRVEHGIFEHENHRIVDELIGTNPATTSPPDSASSGARSARRGRDRGRGSARRADETDGLRQQVQRGANLTGGRDEEGRPPHNRVSETTSAIRSRGLRQKMSALKRRHRGKGDL